MIKLGLARKITITLIAVSITAVILTSVIMLFITRQQFSNYIKSYDQVMVNQWRPIISDYYAQHGSDGLQEYLESNGVGSMGNGMGMNRRGSSSMGMRLRMGQRLVVSDTNGIVLADTQKLLIGQTANFDSDKVKSGPLTIDSHQVGTLYVISPLGSGLASLENDFIYNLTISTGVLAFIIGLIALILGLILGKRISSPLADLSTAIHQVAQGKLDQRIKLQGDQEFIQLGQDFNIMAQHLEDADKNRRRLTADLSHELRTPLTFLRGQLEGMQTGNVPIDSENVTLLLDEVILLSYLVKELDNLALVENHAVSLQIIAFPIEELLERLTPVNIVMQDKGINFSIDVVKDVKEIIADHDRLLQILLNLLSNAMHHAGNPGMVRLSIQRDKDYLQFSVTDNGSGIPAADLPHVFERFYRVDDSRNRREGGMGLGLAIAKGYAEAHNGKMWVESQPDLGTTFYFTLAQPDL
jgi:signal transduction histidine kinase